MKTCAFALLGSRLAIMGRVLGIVYRVIATHLIRIAGCSLHAGTAAKVYQRT